MVRPKPKPSNRATTDLSTFGSQGQREGQTHVVNGIQASTPDLRTEPNPIFSSAQLVVPPETTPYITLYDSISDHQATPSSPSVMKSLCSASKARLVLLSIQDNPLVELGEWSNLVINR